MLLDARRDRVGELSLPPNAVDTCGELSPTELAAVISHLDAVITPDTGPLHLAAALDTPTIAFFSEIPADCRVGYYPNCVGLARPDLCDQYPCGYVDTCEDARCINKVGWKEIEPHLNRMLDTETVTLRHRVSAAEDSSSIAMIANQLARALRGLGACVRQRSLGQDEEIVRDNGFLVEARGRTFALLTCDNDRPCRAWADEIARYDYLLCFSHHVYEACRKAGVPARKLLPFQLGVSDRLLAAAPEPPDVSDETFVFFFNGVCQPRKNVEGAVRAFKQAFGRSENVMLAIKNSPRDWDSAARVVDLAGRDLRARQGRRIRVFSEHWTVERLAGWYARVAGHGAYVHLHRAGGFELPVIEAMAFGARVGTTGWAGVTDYCDDHLFGYRLAGSSFQVGELYAEDEPRPKWAQPSHAEIVEWMRSVHNATDWPGADGAGMARIRRDYTWRRAADRLLWWTRNAHRRYMVFGGSGYGNLGDDAMTLAIARQLGAERCVVSSYAAPGAFPPWFEGIEVRQWGDRTQAPAPALDLLRDIHTVVIGGHGCRWPDILLGLCKHAAVILDHGLKLEWRGIGIDDPKQVPINEDLVRHVFEAAQRVAVRDERTRDILQGLGVCRAIVVEPDPALSLAPAAWSAARKVLSTVLSGQVGPYVVLSLNSMFIPPKAHCRWVKLVERIAERGYEVVAVRMCNHSIDERENDLLIIDELCGQLKDPEPLRLCNGQVSPENMMAIMAGAELVIGMRYHSSVFAYRAGARVIAVSEQDKTTRFCEAHDIPIVKPTELTKLSKLAESALPKIRR